MVEKGECILTHELHCTYIYIQLHTIFNWTLHINSLRIDFSSRPCPRECIPERKNCLLCNPKIRKYEKSIANVSCEFFPYFFARERRQGTEFERGKREKENEWTLREVFIWRNCAHACVCVRCLYMRIHARALTDGRIFGWTLIAGAFRDGKISRLTFALSRQLLYLRLPNRTSRFSFVCNHSRTVKIIDSKLEENENARPSDGGSRNSQPRFLTRGRYIRSGGVFKQFLKYSERL